MGDTSQAVILTYHSVSKGHSPLKISPALFADQMEWLSRNTSVLPLPDLVEALERGAPLPQRSVALTFDDGFMDFYVEAAPILRKFRLHGTIFLPTSYCERTNAWPGQPKWVEEQPLLTWRQIRELADQGFGFGSHSATHAALTDLDATDLESELITSRREIETRINRPVEYFAYPYGRWDSCVHEAARRQYRGACSTAAYFLTPGADLFALPRIDVYYLQYGPCFRSLFAARLQAYLALRRSIRRLRGKSEGGAKRSKEGKPREL